MKKKPIIITILVVVVAAMTLGMVLKNRGGDTDLPSIAAAEVTRKPLIENITASGVFEPEHSEIHLSPITARISEVFLELGDPVQADQIILQIDDTSAKRTLEEAQVALIRTRRTLAQTLLSNKLDYQSQEISLEQAQNSYDKQNQLYALEAVSQEELKRARDNLASAKQSYSASRQRLNMSLGLESDEEPDLNTIDTEAVIDSAPEITSAMLTLDTASDAVADCRITSRKGGFVTRLPYKVGEYVTAGVTVAQVQSLDNMKAVITVDEVDIGKITLGDEAELTSDALLGERVPARVTSIAPIIETIGNARASLVEITPMDSSLPLRSGASCMATITSISKSSALTVPVGTIQTEKGKIQVFLLEEQGNGRYKLNKLVLETGLTTINDVEVVDGLEEGNLVALVGKDYLREGLVVTLQEADDEGTDASSGRNGK